MSARWSRVAVLAFALALGGCAALGQVVSGEFPTAGDAVVGYVADFCDPVVGADERAEILVELNAAIVPHRISIDCASLPPER